MNAAALFGLALKASIFLTVFGFGLQATVDDIVYLVRKPGLLARSLVSMFIVMPLFTAFMAAKFQYHLAVEIALVALAISPVPPLLPRRVAKSGGLVSYGVGLMVTASLLSIVFIPIALNVVGRVSGRSLALGPGTVARLIVTSVLVPLAAGMLFRTVAPVAAGRIGKPVSVVAMTLLTIGVLAIFVVASPVAWALIGNGTVAVIIAFIVIGLAAGHLLGGPDPDERVTLALCTACRHPALALAIAGANFPDEKRVIGAVFLYLILNALVAIPYVTWQSRAIGK